MQRDGVHHGFNLVKAVGAVPQDIQSQIHFRVGVETELLHRLAHLYRHGGYTSAGRFSGEDVVAGLTMRATTLDVTWDPYLWLGMRRPNSLRANVTSAMGPTLPHVLTERMMGTVSVAGGS